MFIVLVCPPVYSTCVSEMGLIIWFGDDVVLYNDVKFVML